MMLIEKGLQSGDIVSLKLTNGDEIIGRYQEETDTHITVERPLAITIGPQGLGMMPWMFLGAKDTIKLRKDHVFVYMQSKSDAAGQYIQGTTGLSIVK